MKARDVFIASFTLTLISCSASVEVFVKPGTAFDRRATITVEGSDDIVPKLEDRLLRVGFEVVSASVAQTTLHYQDQIRNQVDSPSQRIPEVSTAQSDVGRVTLYKSVYLMKVRAFVWPGLFGPVVESFSATVFDLRTGEVVATIDLRTGGGGDKFSLDGFLDQFARKIDEAFPVDKYPSRSSGAWLPNN